MKRNNKGKKVIIVLLMFTMILFLSGCKVEDAAIANNFGDVKGFLNYLAWPMAKFIYFLGKYITHWNYGLALIIATIVVRSIAWPIYAKTNDMSLKMQLIAPEQQKIEEKYKDRTDPTSQQAKQMEMAQLYKKYGIGLGGCLLPFLQFPIFMAFYSVVRNAPQTPWITDVMNFNFLGIDLSQGRKVTESFIGNPTYQKWSIVVLAALVGATQIISQIIANNRQKKLKEETQSNIPEYRRQQPTEAQAQTEKSMQFMIYGLTAMMVVLVFTSPAGLGLYWLVGNIYSTVQGYISHRLSGNRLEKLKDKYN